MTVTAPTPAASIRAVCDAVAAALPATVAGQERRTVSPSTTLTAAWGDPPVVLRCGVPAPAALTGSSQLYTVDGVDWFPEDLTEGTLFTTYGRRAYVEVAVPQAYAPEADVLTDLSAALAAADPLSS